jgi:hypothetical protein
MSETAAPASAPISGDQFERLIAALTAQAQTQQPLDKAALKEILTETAQLSASSMQKAMKPENDTHPGISALSYPEGDVARPRPTLPFECFYNRYPVHKFPETQHWRELELLAEVKPGKYTVIRRDNTPMPVEVLGTKDANGNLTKIEIEFAVSREEKALVPPMAVLLYQIVHPDNPRKRFLEAMQEYYQILAG